MSDSRFMLELAAAGGTLDDQILFLTAQLKHLLKRAMTPVSANMAFLRGLAGVVFDKGSM
jgi:hypothetical protein